jgi:hypothetical protein
MGKRILVLGGYGVFGSRISQAIARIPAAECVIGGPHPQKAAPYLNENITAVTVNVRDAASLRRALDGVFAVVNAAGPFQARDYAVAEACAASGIHYVDLAEARSFVEGIGRLNRRAQQHNCLLVSGTGLSPTISSLLVEMLLPDFDHISEIHTAVSIGNRSPRGEASVRSVLACVGAAIRLKERGRWRYAYGWSEPRTVHFPAPVGRRRVYLCDVPDLDIFPARYGAQTVTFRAGLELSLGNGSLALLGWMRRHRWARNLPDWAPGLIAAGSLLRNAGSPASGMRVLVRGRRNGQDCERAVFLIARDANAAAIPGSPSVALVRQWIEQGIAQTGAMPGVGLLRWDDIRNELADYDIRLVRI